MSYVDHAEILTRLLRRIPGANWSCRVNTQTGEHTWIYMDAKMAELYGISEAEIRADPAAGLRHLLPEDRPAAEELMKEGFRTMSPASCTSRVLHSTGELRWIECHVEFEPETESSMLVYGQIFDITERMRLEQALRDSEVERRRVEVLHRTVIDMLPVGVILANRSRELLIFNPAQQRMSGGTVQHDDGNITSAYGVFMADGKTPLPMENSGISRALNGEEHEVDVVIRNPRLRVPVVEHLFWKPMCDESGTIYAALGVGQDITSHRDLETTLRQRNAELAASEAAKTELIDKLRYSIQELSTPILEIWDDVLVMPIIGVIDSRRTADMVQRLLTEVARSQASYVIVDLTGVEIVDTKTADHLLKLIRKVEVVGARCVLTGIRPAVAETLVEIGVDFGRITTLRNLKHGLRDAMRFARHEREGAQSDRGADHLGQWSDPAKS
jgi:rsbT co-antagonist protein RsbR